MPHRSPTLLSTTRYTVRVHPILNAVAGVGFVGVLALTNLEQDERLRNAPTGAGDPATELFWVRVALVLCVAIVPLAHLLFTRLGAIAGSVETALPVAAANAVLLLFVLARVFERGAAIEDELAGTL